MKFSILSKNERKSFILVAWYTIVIFEHVDFLPKMYLIFYLSFANLTTNIAKISSPAELNYERGCEVSAVLHHGSYVRFGCLQFVLSILSYENEEIKEEQQEEKEENEKTTELETEMIKKESEEM